MVKCECIEGYYLYDEVLFECRLCEGLCKSCNRIECTSCVDNAEVKEGRCYCNEGYYLSKSYTSNCIPCLEESCKTCYENEGIYECTSCNYPYILSDSKLCICDEEFYYTQGNECIAIDFTLELRPSLNNLELHFNQALSKELNFIDLQHEILDKEILSQLDTKFYILDKYLSYGISYSSTYSTDNSISVRLTVSNTVQNVQNRSLKISSYDVIVPILFKNNTVSNSTDLLDEADSSNENFTDLGNIINFAIVVTVSTATVVNLLNFNLNAIWVLLSTLQIFSYSPLLNIKLPSKLRTIAQGMSFNFLPNIFEFFMKYETDSTPKRYEEMGYDTTIYLMNCGDLLTMLIINIFFYLLLKLMHNLLRKSDLKVTKLVSKLVEGYEWGFYLRFWIQGYLNIAVTSSFTLKYLPDDIEIPDYIIAILSFVIFT
jgi:hypothetical protein